MVNLLLLRLASNDLPRHACVHSCVSTGKPRVYSKAQGCKSTPIQARCLLSTYYMHDYTSVLEGDTLKWVTWFPSEAIKVLKVPPFGRGYTVKRGPDLILTLQTQSGVQETLPFQWRLLDGPLLSERGWVWTLNEIMSTNFLVSCEEMQSPRGLTWSVLIFMSALHYLVHESPSKLMLHWRTAALGGHHSRKSSNLPRRQTHSLQFLSESKH